MQVACLGLVKAIDRFDLERGRVLQLRRADDPRRDQALLPRPQWSVRVPRDLQELALRVDRAVANAVAGPAPPADRRRRSRSASAPRRSTCSRRWRPPAPIAPTSLEAPRGTEDDRATTLGDTLGTDEHGFALAEDRATIARLSARSPPRERDMLRLRFEEDLTQGEIGEHIGVSQMQVSRIIRQSLGRLRSYATPHARDTHARAGPSG